MINENNCLVCAEYKAKPSGDLQEVCQKLDTVIQLLENSEEDGVLENLIEQLTGDVEELEFISDILTSCTDEKRK